MVDAEIVREWFAKAEEDYQFGLTSLKEDNGFFPQICFHFQQAAEKYLKTYIIAHELEFRKVHDLPLLLKICLSRDPSFEQFRENCEFLTTFYVETRYPVHWPTRFSLDEAQKALHSATRIRSFVKDKLGMIDSIT